MHHCVIIPTFWTRPKGRRSDVLLNIYDHPTPVDQDGTLLDCLRSLESVDGLDKVIIIVAATHPSVEAQAEARVLELLERAPGIDAIVFGPAELGSLHRRMEQLEFADMIPGATLLGYGAVRNLGLICAAVLGCETAVFVDDDQIVADEDFLSRAFEGLGCQAEEGGVVLAKSGYYVDDSGARHVDADVHFSDMFWRQTDAYNEALATVDAPPRLKRSPVVFGGCLALHRDMYCNVSFDPWVVRGEDVDYVINVMMHGGHAYLDGEWSIVHRPPAGSSEALGFRQDVYRFIYEHRKLEFSKSQVDLRPVTPQMLSPYPGEFVGSSVTWRAVVTALLRALSGRDSGRYLKVARAAFGDVRQYARTHCQDYFEFQRRWPLLMDRIWDDVALGSLFTGERSVDRSALTGRFPAVRDD
jgi:hypothetical protein